MLLAQHSRPSELEINKLISDYHHLFVNSKLVVDSIIDNVYIKDQGLWQDFLLDQKINSNNSATLNEINVSKSAFSDLGLKWVSDATHNFSPGISDNEDVNFRSRISTGIDWVVLGEGSWIKGKRSYNLFQKQMQKDSIGIQLQQNTISLQNKISLLHNIIDQHRINVLKKYEVILQYQSAYYNEMFKNGLSSYGDTLKASQQLQEIQSIIELNKTYLEQDLDAILLKRYWNLPFGETNLPPLETISEENLLQEKEAISQLQKEIIQNNRKSSEMPSFRVKLRYNYYDTAEQMGRSFSSVAASLSIPLRFKRETDEITYQIATNENKLNYEKQQLKEQLIAQHRQFNVLKTKSLQIKNELLYIEALLKNELEIYTNENKDFSPTKYIEYSGRFIQKMLDFLEIKQTLCETYIIFGTLSKLNDNSLSEKTATTTSTEYEQITYMWKSYFESHSNDQLIEFLKANKITNLFLSPGSNKLKITEFIQKATQQNIKVDRLLGENSFAEKSDGLVKLIEKLEKIKEDNFSGIHLNIEPHTFDDYKENKEKYIERMNQIYAQAQAWCGKNNIKLSVSIPLHLPIENATFLSENKIEAYIMAYETTDQLKLLNRTKTLRNVLEGNFIWVLRLSDFTNEKMLNTAEITLKENGVDRIGYYEFSALNDF